MSKRKRGGRTRHPEDDTGEQLPPLIMSEFCGHDKAVQMTCSRESSIIQWHRNALHGRSLKPAFNVWD